MIFGLARSGGFEQRGAELAADDVQTQTELGLRAGTVPYMSPEQARGAATDFRSDQFSLGLVLYEMVANRPAFRRDTPAATLDAIINDEPAVTELEARAPLLLRWIIERCLAKDPGDRYAVTADLHRDVRTLRDRLREAMSRETGATAATATPNWKRVLTTAVLVGALTAGVVLYGLRPGVASLPRCALPRSRLSRDLKGFRPGRPMVKPSRTPLRSTAYSRSSPDGFRPRRPLR